MKVLEVIRQGQIGGGESHLLDLVTNFDKTLIKPEVLSFTDGPMVDILREQNIPCYVIHTHYPFDFRVYNHIKNIIKQQHFDLIHAHGSRAASNIVYIANSLKIPLIYTVHGWSFHSSESKLAYKLRVLSEKYICNHVQQVICVSYSNLETGLKLFKIANPIVIENGVDINKFDPYALNGNLRDELGFKKNDFIVGCICRITLQKDPISFLAGIEKAHKIDANIKGLLVGNGDMDEEVKNFIEKHQMQSYIIRQPFRTDVPLLMHTIDVFCLPSLWEGLSMVLLEAMSMAKPIVITPTDGTKDVIINGENGTIVNFKDVDAMAHAYIQYKNQAQYATLLGRNARSLVLQKFNNKRVVEEVTEIYQKLL